MQRLNIYRHAECLWFMAYKRFLDWIRQRIRRPKRWWERLEDEE